MKYAIIGGTGTLGTALLSRLDGDITVFSRGELAQKKTAQEFPEAKMVIGDVRDREAVSKAVAGADVVFLLAAIKHVDIAEQNPLEAIKTNVLGAVNVCEAALEAGAKYVVYSNTDKAVLPITTYGYTKALAQNYVLAQNGKSKTKFSVFTWGNIAASRGSVIQTFVDALLSGRPVPLTHVSMSRFWLTIDTAADFMLSKYKSAPADAAMIPPVKGAPVLEVIHSIARILSIKDFKVEVTGLRGTEKIHECLETSHNFCLRSDTCDQFTDSELDAFLGDIVRGLAGESRLKAELAC